MVAGYPVIHVTGHHELKYGGCALDVGITDHSYVWLTDSDPDAFLRATAGSDAGKPSCAGAERAAAMVIQKLEAGR
jgi:hypothetical protein